ncbi:MAG: hypothetical protein VKN72_29055, partial [Nostocales cyanobacterium 94392]|nr:hypothetical protein [Nostocales cyanobacterium 94392]
LFEQEELEGYIGEFLGIERQESQEVLRAIASQHGLLIERSYRVWSFSHLTFQEYLISSFFVVNIDFKRLASHIQKLHWHEVFLLSVLSCYEEAECNNLIIEMSKSINGLVAKDKNIQELLTCVHQKSLFVQVPHWYHPAAIRALYFDMARFINCATNIEINAGIEKSFLLSNSIDQELVTSLALAIEIGRTRHFYKNIELVFDIDFTHTIVETYNLGDNLETCLNLLNDYIDDAANFNSEIGKELRLLQQYMRDNLEKTICNTLIKKIQEIMIANRNIGHIWQFSREQKKVIQEYYDANRLLATCLDSICAASSKIRAEIAENLILPIAEIEKRKSEQQTE